RQYRWMEHQVAVHDEAIEVELLGATRQPLEIVRWQRRRPAEAEFEIGGSIPAHVRSAARRRLTPTRSIRMFTRSSGSGQQTSESVSSQSLSASVRCFAGSTGKAACIANRQKLLPSGIVTVSSPRTSK